MTRTRERFSLGTEVFGSALEEAIEQAAQAGRELVAPERLPPDQDTRLSLCLIRTYKSDNVRHLPTMSAEQRIEGDIVLGPFGHYTRRPTMEALQELLWAHRWVFHPLERGGGTRNNPAYTLRSSPNLQIISRIELSCECGYRFRTFRDLAVRNSRTPDGRQASSWSPENVVHCDRCQKVMQQRRLWCTAEQDREGYSDDPILKTDTRLGYVKEQILEEMLACWEKGAEAGARVQLPRIWALYAQGTAPDPAWAPDRRDGRANRLADYYANEFMAPSRVQGTDGRSYNQPVQMPLSILPYGVAKRYHQAPTPLSQAAVDFVVESERFQIGWVQMKDLYPNQADGFKRQLWHLPKDVEHNPKG